MPRNFRSTIGPGLFAVAAAAAVVAACSTQPMSGSMMSAMDGPAEQGPPLPQQLSGDAALGQDVFRFETFGNEGFWTDAVRLPAGIMGAKVTPLQALELGLQVDADAIDAQTRAQLMRELAADPSGRTSALLNNPEMTGKLIMANAVMGMVPKGDKVGATCALCHSMSDGAVFKSPKGGSIGKRLDGLANADLNMGKIFATAANTRALYPVAQVKLDANKGNVLGRAPFGLTGKSTEAEFDSYFGNPEYYPIGMFDDTFDGNGDPMQNTPLFEQDLAAPYGSEGLVTKIDDFSNLVFTSLLDQTMLTTPGGREFVHTLAGAAGDELINTYVQILADTGVKGYPYAEARRVGKSGDLATPVGARVDDRKLLAMNAYLASLLAPVGRQMDASAARGKTVFETSGCISCHNSDQSKPVPTTLHAMAEIWPGDRPATLAQRMPPLNDVLNSPGQFDDKMAVVNATLRGERRGLSMPLLLDLARKASYLHDSSVPSLDALLNSNRGGQAPPPSMHGKRSTETIW